VPDKTRPLVFIGSSAEGLVVAEAVQSNLDRSCETEIWSQGTFGLSEGTLESLVKRVNKYDFAILVLTPDDFITSRDEGRFAPRDNVLLELGLFIGALGINRTFMVCNRAAKLKLPSDLAGITPATFQPPETGTMQAAVGAACTAIKAAVKELGIRDHKPVEISAGYIESVKGNGIFFTVTNIGREDFPPYKVAIFHPKRGSFFIFPSENSGPLLPDQKRQHECHVFQNGKLRQAFPKFDDYTHHDELVHVNIEDFRFRLVLENSDKVLYEDAGIGQGFARLIRKVIADGKFGDESVDDWRAIHG